MLDEERNHNAILNKAIDNGFWLRACDLYLNHFEPSECQNVVKTVKRDYREPPRRSKPNGNTVNGLVWTDSSTSKRRKTQRSR